MVTVRSLTVAKCSIEGFQALGDAFAESERCAPGAGPKEGWYEIAGRPVRFRVAGDDLARQVVLPFGHVRIEVAPAEPALVVDLWSEDETGVAPPALLVEDDVSSTGSGDTTITLSGDGRFVRYESPRLVAWLDRSTSHVIGCARSAGFLSAYECARPLQALLTAWGADLGVQLVHAAFVARDGLGVLIVGHTGAGKSSTALACLVRGFACLSDDCVGLERAADGTFVGHSFYSSVQLDPGQMEHFPTLAAAAVPPRIPIDEKSVVYLAEAAPDRAARSARIGAVVLPRLVDATESTLGPGPRSEALRTLGLDALEWGLGAWTEGLDQLARLLAAVPVQRLDLGRDRAAVAVRVDDALRQVVTR